MRKLKLQVDELRIETFEVHANLQEPQGTVRGHGARMTQPEFACSTEPGDWGCGADFRFQR